MSRFITDIYVSIWYIDFDKASLEVLSLICVDREAFAVWELLDHQAVEAFF
jgi:hypothetical protein